MSDTWEHCSATLILQWEGGNKLIDTTQCNENNYTSNACSVTIPSNTNSVYWGCISLGSTVDVQSTKTTSVQVGQQKGWPSNSNVHFKQ
jgi:hypothetical protein